MGNNPNRVRERKWINELINHTNPLSIRVQFSNLKNKPKVSGFGEEGTESNNKSHLSVSLNGIYFYHLGKES